MKPVAMAWILALTLVGCVRDSHHGSPVSPTDTVEISGTVIMPDGSPVWTAKVSSLNQVTFTNRLGVFHLALPFSSDSVMVAARDGNTPGVVYAVTHFGSIKIRPDRDRMVGIVLRYSTPI